MWLKPLTSPPENDSNNLEDTWSPLSLGNPIWMSENNDIPWYTDIPMNLPMFFFSPKKRGALFLKLRGNFWCQVFVLRKQILRAYRQLEAPKGSAFGPSCQDWDRNWVYSSVLLVNPYNIFSKSVIYIYNKPMPIGIYLPWTSMNHKHWPSSLVFGQKKQQMDHPLEP